MMPACSHTGTPLHFHSSTTSGSACFMRVRTRASISPRQSLSSLILASISCAGEAPPFPSFAPLFLCFMVVVAFFMAVVPRTYLALADLRGLAAFAAARLAAGFFATFADVLDILWRRRRTFRSQSLVHPLEQIFEVVEPALPEPGHLACPVDQRGQGAELRAIVRLPSFMAVAHQPGLLQKPEML